MFNRWLAVLDVYDLTTVQPGGDPDIPSLSSWVRDGLEPVKTVLVPCSVVAWGIGACSSMVFVTSECRFCFCTARLGNFSLAPRTVVLQLYL